MVTERGDMARKRFKAEQIVVMLREVEIQMAKGWIYSKYAATWAFRNRPTTGGEKNTVA